MLGLFTETHGVRVGEDVQAMVALDDASLAARVAGKPRVPDRVDVACQDRVARLEARLRPVRAARAAASEQDDSNVARAERAVLVGGRATGAAGPELFR